MNNPWLSIPLDDYESHMSLPQVQQANLLATLLEESITRFNPSSVAIFGCSGGNGLEMVSKSDVERVVGIDINQEYLDRARYRYEGKIPHLDLLSGDLGSDQFDVEPVDLVFAGLIFEYVDTKKLLEQANHLLNKTGKLISIIQLEGDQSFVTPSPYASLDKVSSILHKVTPESVTKEALNLGFKFDSDRTMTISSGKSFHLGIFTRG